METPSAEFIKNLRDEKLRAQDARTSLTLQKMAFATTLLGLSSLKIEVAQVNTVSLFYLVPWVAIVFDFYIMGEDYSVKRIGSFLGANSRSALEHRWEHWVSRFRDPFARWAMPILTTLLLIGALLVGLPASINTNNPPLWVLIVWAAASLLVSWSMFFTFARLQRKARKSLTKETLIQRTWLWQRSCKKQNQLYIARFGKRLPYKEHNTRPKPAHKEH